MYLNRACELSPVSPVRSAGSGRFRQGVRVWLMGVDWTTGQSSDWSAVVGLRSLRVCED